MKQITTLLLLLMSSLTFAQINYQGIRFNEALNRANAEGKILFVQFESATCHQCNEVADKGLSTPKLADQIEQTFIPLKIAIEHPDRQYIGEQYNISKGFGTLFIDQQGTLIHAFHQSTTRSSEYHKQIDLALNKAGESLQINKLEEEYKKGNKSPGFMEALLLKKRALNLPTDILLDEYVASLPTDSFQSTRTLLFLAQMAPTVNSAADVVMRKDRMLFNKAWYQMPLPTRIGINNQIIHKSMVKAIQEKNEAFAKRVASFAGGTHDGNQAAGKKAYEKNMLKFYEETGDSTNYFKRAIAYYEQYLMVISADSIKRIDSVNKERLRAMAKKDTVRDGTKVRISSSFSYRPIAQNFMAELNNAAWTFYKKTTDPYLLSVATAWSARALEFFESPDAIDTYARLLYKQGKKQTAIELENKALALHKKQGFATKELEEIIAKMKADKAIE